MTDDNPERKLWRAVVSQAMSDAVRMDKKSMLWIEDGGEHSKKVFEWADVDLDRTIVNMKKLVVFMARSSARGRKIKLKFNKLSWLKPSNAEKERCIEFLESPLGQRYQSEVGIDDNESENRLRALQLLHG